MSFDPRLLAYVESPICILAFDSIFVCYPIRLFVVRIPLKGDEILRVHGERTQGVVKTLMNTKVEFHIDLVHGATSVAKSPYRLAPLEMQELSEQLQELQDEEEHGVHLKLELELLRKEKLYAKYRVGKFEIAHGEDIDGRSPVKRFLLIEGFVWFLKKNGDLFEGLHRPREKEKAKALSKCSELQDV
ncbi:hypothetical protein Tco_1292995 [Tanacetum coccineum]